MTKVKSLVENEQSPVQILEGYSDGYNRAKLLVTTVDVNNRNGRTYPKSLAERETQMRFAGSVLGQSKHPSGEPDILEQFIVWEQALMEGDDEWFVAKIIPTQRGKDFTEIAKAGAMVSCSRRGSGELMEGTDKHGKKTKIVKPESYQLIGIDVLYPNVQSNAKSMHTIHFEAVEPTEDTDMDELTLEQLREERGDLVEEISKPLEEKVAELQEQVTSKDAVITQANADFDSVNEKLEQATKDLEQATVLAQENAAQAEAKATQLSETQTKLDELTAKFDALNAHSDNTQKVLEETVQAKDALTEQVNTLNARLEAQKHLREKVKGEKAAWLILESLSDAATVAEIDEKFEAAKQAGDKVIETIAAPQGKSTYQGAATDDEKIKENEKEKSNPVLEASKRVAKHTGI